MFCLRSWLPLLFIPTNASPLFILSFITLTYLLHRPCIYCSALLLILFLSSCHWSDRCFLDFNSDWFAPRFAGSLSSPAGNGTTTSLQVASSPTTTPVLGQDSAITGLAEYVLETLNTTATALAGAALEGARQHLSSSAMSSSSGAVADSGDSDGDIARAAGTSTSTSTTGEEGEWTGIGLVWLRSLLGRREWTLPCVDVKIRL